MYKALKNNYSFCLILASLTILFGCVKKQDQADAGLDPKETLRFNLTTEPPSLDWGKSTDTTSNQVIVNLMEGLTGYDFVKSPDLKLYPALATEWTASNKAKTWTFTLRQGVKWSDGQEFTAKHVVDAWERLLNPATAADYAYFLYNVKNGREYNQGKLKDFSQVGIRAEGDYKVVVELNGSMGYFPHMTAHHSLYPIRKDIIEKYGEKWTEPGNIVTLGAYTLKNWVHDKSLLMVRNENYYGKKPAVKNILCQMILEETTAINLFNAQKLDSQDPLPGSQMEMLRQNEAFRRVNTLLMYYYGFNTTKKPFDNVLVRKAVAMAIDRNQLVRVLNGGQLPMASWIPAGMMGHEPNKGLQFNPEKARELLKQAGYADPTKVPRITIAFNTLEDHKRIAENIQAQLKTNLGLNVELQNEEWKVYINRLKNDAPQIFRMGWLADYPDPDNFMNLFTSYSENNYTKWKNPKYDRLVEQAAGELDEEKRKQLYSQAQDLLVVEDVPMIPLYNGVRNKFVSKRVENFPLNALDLHMFKEVILR